MVKERYHHGNLPQVLIETALALIEAEGVSALSLRDLARRVAVSPTAVYRHFSDKDALLAAIAAEGYMALNAAFAASLAAAANDPGARLHALGTAYVGFALGHPGLYRLMFGAGRSTKDPEPMLRECSEQAYATLVAAVAAHLGPAAPLSAIAEATMAAWSLVHGYAMLRLEGPVAHLSAGALPDAASVLVHLLPKA